jgi:hypothetical protein
MHPRARCRGNTSQMARNTASTCVASLRIEFNRFKEGGGVEATNIFLPDDWALRSFVAESLAGRMGTLGCINHRDAIVSRYTDSRLGLAIPSFSLQSHNWKDVFEQLIIGANCIVLHLCGHSLTEDVQFEIDTIQKHAMQRRCLVVSREVDLGTKAVTKGFGEVFTWNVNGERERLTTLLHSLTADNFRQTQPVKDLPR